MRLLQPEKGLGCGGGELAACSQVRLTSASQYVRRYCLKYSCKHYRLTTSWAAQGLLVDYYYNYKLLLAIHYVTTTINTITTTTTTTSSLPRSAWNRSGCTRIATRRNACMRAARTTKCRVNQALTRLHAVRTSRV